MKQALTSFDLVLEGNEVKGHTCCGEGCMWTQIQSEIPMIYFVLDSGWFFEDLLFQLQQNYCNSPLQAIAFIGSLAMIL